MSSLNLIAKNERPAPSLLPTQNALIASNFSLY